MSLTKVAKEDQTSINQFIAIAVAEKYLHLIPRPFSIREKRKEKADMDAFERVLLRKGGEVPRG